MATTDMTKQIEGLESLLKAYRDRFTALEKLTAAVHVRKPNTAYAVGDVAYAANLPSWARLECQTAGTTSTNEELTIS